MVSGMVSESRLSGVVTGIRPLEALRSQLVGQLLTTESEEYDQARQIQFIQVDRRPLAIVRPAEAEDVAATVNFAREREFPLSVRSGGHSLGHFGVVDGAIVVDLSSMKRVSINPETRIARVQAGATSNDIAGPANALGLALSTGDTGSVGIGGLTVGGGIGFMVRKYGLTIDNLLSAQVVLASGEIVTASETEYPDLFWAIRGGGGNFGIVTEFTFQLAPVGMILGGDLMLPATKEVIRGYLEYAATAPDELTTLANIMHAPPAPYVPQDRLGEVVLSILVVWTGDPAEGERALAPLRALATPVADAVGVMPYPAIYQFTAHQEMRHGGSIRSMFSYELSDETIEASLDAIRNATSPYSIVHLRGLGGALARVESDATAFAHRDQPYFFAAIGIWLDPEEDGLVHESWVDALWQTARKDSAGVYVNFLENEGRDRVRDAYPVATYERLSMIKKLYDPQNFFRFNQNIAPKR